MNNCMEIFQFRVENIYHYYNKLTMNYPVFTNLIADSHIISKDKFITNIIYLYNIEKSLVLTKNLLSLYSILITFTSIFIFSLFVYYFSFSHYIIILRICTMFIITSIIVFTLWILYCCDLNLYIYLEKIKYTLTTITRRILNIFIYSAILLLIAFCLKVIKYDYYDLSDSTSIYSQSSFLSLIAYGISGIFEVIWYILKPNPLLAASLDDERTLEFARALAQNNGKVEVLSIAEARRQIHKPENKELLALLPVLNPSFKYTMRPDIPKDFYDSMISQGYSIETINRIAELASSVKVYTYPLAYQFIMKRIPAEQILFKPKIIEGIAVIESLSKQNKVLGKDTLIKDFKRAGLVYELGAACTNIMMTRFKEIDYGSRGFIGLKPFNYQVTFGEIKGNVSDEAKKLYLESIIGRKETLRLSRNNLFDHSSHLDSKPITTNKDGWANLNKALNQE